MPESSTPVSSSRIPLFGVVALVLFCVAPVANRFGWIDYRLSIPLIALSFLLALVLFVWALVQLLRPSKKAQRKALLVGLLFVSPPLVALIVLMMSTMGTPVIHQVSTDTKTPPEFVLILPLRVENSNPIQYSSALAETQAKHYPQLTSILTELPLPVAVKLCKDTLADLGWAYVGETATASQVLIEATESTRWFGFVDDIVIRVVTEGAGSRIDLRSISRVGKGDMGANADRVEKFIEAFNQRATTFGN